MMANYYNAQIGVVDASGTVNVIYPITKSTNVDVTSKVYGSGSATTVLQTALDNIVTALGSKASSSHSHSSTIQAVSCELYQSSTPINGDSSSGQAYVFSGGGTDYKKFCIFFGWFKTVTSVTSGTNCTLYAQMDRVPGFDASTSFSCNIITSSAVGTTGILTQSNTQSIRKSNSVSGVGGYRTIPVIYIGNSAAPTNTSIRFSCIFYG